MRWTARRTRLRRVLFLIACPLAPIRTRKPLVQLGKIAALAQMNEFHFIQSPFFSVFVSNGKICYVSDGATAPVLVENRSSEIAHELWKSAALPRHQGDLVAGIVGLYSEMEISQALAKMLQEGIIVAGSKQDIAALLRPPSRSLPCERLLVC